MPSDLQRVARGLVECLDEVPQVVAHLQRTADRCRENAALAIAASHGRATVAAQQLDAAARACEAAAHYLSMAPPKAKSWAERLVGDGRTTHRPDAGSADRNRATQKRADVAERDPRGRTKRLVASYEPDPSADLDDLAELADEAAEREKTPLVVLARTAYEKFRRRQERDEERREEPEPLELEVFTDEKGFVAVSERRREDEKRAEAGEDRDGEREAEPAYLIEVDVTKAAENLLRAMTTDDEAWEHAEFTITPTHVTATFDYPDDPPVTPIEVPAVKMKRPPQPDFDPAFDARPLGQDFTPGVVDPHNLFDPAERLLADRLAAEGWRVDPRRADHTRQGEKNPDAMIRRSSDDPGRVTEFKSPQSPSANGLKRCVDKAARQVGGIGGVVIDGRKTGTGPEEALRAIRRSRLQPGRPARVAQVVVHIILGDGRLISDGEDD